MSQAQRKSGGKHIPQRTCVVCRQTTNKRALFRIVHDPERGLVVDATGKMKGRGAYLCHEQACWVQAAVTDVLDRALRTTLTAQAKAQLLEQCPVR